jgi:hypothetical protein
VLKKAPADRGPDRPTHWRFLTINPVSKYEVYARKATAAPKQTLICAREDSLLSALGVRKRRPKFLSNELLLVLAVGLIVGALGLWLILRVSA